MPSKVGIFWFSTPTDSTSDKFPLKDKFNTYSFPFNESVKSLLWRASSSHRFAAPAE